MSAAQVIGGVAGVLGTVVAITALMWDTRSPEEIKAAAAPPIVTSQPIAVVNNLQSPPPTSDISSAATAATPIATDPNVCKNDPYMSWVYTTSDGYIKKAEDLLAKTKLYLDRIQRAEEMKALQQSLIDEGTNILYTNTTLFTSFVDEIKKMCGTDVANIKRIKIEELFEQHTKAQEDIRAFLDTHATKVETGKDQWVSKSCYDLKLQFEKTLARSEEILKNIEFVLSQRDLFKDKVAFDKRYFEASLPLKILFDSIDILYTDYDTSCVAPYQREQFEILSKQLGDIREKEADVISRFEELRNKPFDPPPPIGSPPATSVIADAQYKAVMENYPRPTNPQPRSSSTPIIGPGNYPLNTEVVEQTPPLVLPFHSDALGTTQPARRSSLPSGVPRTSEDIQTILNTREAENRDRQFCNSHINKINVFEHDLHGILNDTTSPSETLQRKLETIENVIDEYKNSPETKEMFLSCMSSSRALFDSTNKQIMKTFEKVKTKVYARICDRDTMTINTINTKLADLMKDTILSKESLETKINENVEYVAAQRDYLKDKTRYCPSKNKKKLDDALKTFDFNIQTLKEKANKMFTPANPFDPVNTSPETTIDYDEEQKLFNAELTKLNSMLDRVENRIKTIEVKIDNLPTITENKREFAREIIIELGSLSSEIIETISLPQYTAIFDKDGYRDVLRDLAKFKDRGDNLTEKIMVLRERVTSLIDIPITMGNPLDDPLTFPPAPTAPLQAPAPSLVPNLPPVNTTTPEPDQMPAEIIIRYRTDFRNAIEATIGISDCKERKNILDTFIADISTDTRISNEDRPFLLRKIQSVYDRICAISVDPVPVASFNPIGAPLPHSPRLHPAPSNIPLEPSIPQYIFGSPPRPLTTLEAALLSLSQIRETHKTPLTGNQKRAIVREIEQIVTGATAKMLSEKSGNFVPDTKILFTNGETTKNYINNLQSISIGGSHPKKPRKQKKRTTLKQRLHKLIRNIVEDVHKN